MPGPHRAPYPPEFRAEAVRLVQAGDARIAQVARDLGVNAETLNRPGNRGGSGARNAVRLQTGGVVPWQQS